MNLLLTSVSGSYSRDIKLNYMEYIKAYKEQNAYALWEERSANRATAIFKADGMPPKALKEGKKHAERQALVQVKKDMYIVCRNCNEVKVYQVLYPFTNRNGRHLIKAEVVNVKNNGRWKKTPDDVVKQMAAAVDKKIKKDMVVSVQPLTIPIFNSTNGYHILYEQCGAECSTIVCEPNGKPAKSVYMFSSPGEYGRQAVVPVFPHFKVLQGHRTAEGYEISIYEILRTFTDHNGPQAEVALRNHCVNGQWQKEVPPKVFPLTVSLVDKIEGTDTRTILSKMQ